MRVFHITIAQHEQLAALSLTSYDPNYLVPPFPRWKLVVDDCPWEKVAAGTPHPAPGDERDSSKSSKVFESDAWVCLDSLLIDATAGSTWTVCDRFLTKTEARGEVAGISGVRFNVQDGLFEDLNIRAGRSSKESFLQPDDENIERPEGKTSVIVALNFVLLLQHRDVSIESIPSPDAPLNRQQRRAIERSGGDLEAKHYKIVLREKTTVEGALHNVRNYERLRYPRPHSVRGHLRTLKTGKVVKVRNYERGGLKGTFNADNAEYDATRLNPSKIKT
ncbi:MAG TPA: hypothetical protein VGZ00_08240 [Candidatus Baltobacteraceae bacterium]|nr:hypothetical protein [Candidatus Baltobacteraceae bacterium]